MKLPEPLSSESSDSQPITLLDDDGDEDEDIPIAKLTRSYKRDKKLRPVNGHSEETSDANAANKGSASGKGKKQKRVTKSIKQE